ncbi:MAG: hypothetical protein QM733_16615 [Ilumatobacteraceae bacterium]
MSLLLDAGALIGYERGHPVVIGALDHAAQEQIPVLTSAAVAAQVWRDRARQVQLARLMRGVDERPLDATASPAIGSLLGRSGTPDVVDAALVWLARDGDEILTSDPADIRALLEARGVRVFVTIV